MDHNSIPTGGDRNNYIVIDRTYLSHRIHKYNIDINKWIEIDGINNIENKKAQVASTIKLCSY